MADVPILRRTDRVLPIVTGVGLLLIASLAIYLLWPAANSAAQRERVIQEITVLQPPPPPPPPPEPEEKIMEEEPEIVEPTDNPKVQQDVETPVDTPTDAPPSPNPPSEAAGLDRAADAGSDSFRLAAGRGGGLFGRGGGGGGGGGWGAFVETHVRRALQRDPRTRSANGFVRVVLNIDGNGRFVGAALRSTTGDDRLDAAIRDVLSGLPPLGRGRPPKVEGLTNATINMKRTDG